MKIYVKNMVCDRCKMAIETLLRNHGLHPNSISLGEVELEENGIIAEKYQSLKEDLEKLGFELLEDKKKTIVNQIKAAVINLTHYDREALKVNLSSYLADKLAQDYSYLSNIFSNEEKNTIEHFYIQQKVERAKELLSYGELTLSEIAYQLNYSSVAHLSAQFKKETGLTPSHFKRHQERKTLDQI